MDPPKSIPLYRKVAETVKQRILNNQYAAGGLIPPARELADEFEVSNITIRKAMEVLTSEGFLVPRQGWGTMVAENSRDLLEIRLTGNFNDWFDSASGRRPKLTADILACEKIRPPERVRVLLGLPPETEVWRMLRLRRLEKTPVSFFRNYFPSGLRENIDPRAVEERSFIEVFQETNKIRFTRLVQRVEASMADLDLADVLGVEFGAPLFFIENTYFAAGPRPVVVTHMFYRGDRYVYRADFPLTSSE
ncbi:MAG: GntR family transcriptional regulator [Pseudomonadota bacterium]